MLSGLSGFPKVLIFFCCNAADLKEPAKVEVGSVEASENSANAKNSKATQLAEAKVSVEETVLVDEGGVKITAKSLNEDGIFGAELISTIKRKGA